MIHTQTQEGPTDADAVYRDTYAYVDGLGRAIVSVDAADPVTDGHAFVVQGLTEYDNKGAARRAFLPWFWDGDPRAYPLAQAPSTPYSRQRYDAFGRQVQTYGLDGALILRSVYHALSVDKWDAADLSPGAHAGTFASARQDGHGRAVSSIERVHAAGGIEVHETRTDYLPTGEPYRITRTRGQGDDVVRWLRYDTLGRMVLNVEPDTTKGFTADVTADPGSLKAWRYAYDDAGDLVGTSDARGCGGDYYYDAGGRIRVEDYSPCTAAQAPYSRANADTGAGAEVYYQYDAVPTSLPGEATGTTFDTCTVDPALQNGRLVVVSDRAARTVTGVDGRGRATCVARQLAKPGVPSDSPTDRYTPVWFSRAVAFDGADRPVDASTGAKVLVDPQSGVSVEHTEYTSRGTVKRVASSYGTKDATGWADLVSSVAHDADGLVTAIVYGDVAHTTTATSYDGRRRRSSVQTYRGAPAIWTAQPPAYAPAPQFGAGTPTTFQLLLEDTDYIYDAVDNPVAIRDWRNPAEWPAGAKPVSRKIQYDDLYRVTRTDYQIAGGADTWTNPFDAEDSGQASEQDARRGKPSPHLGFAKRPLWQTYQYDWLGNTTQTDDDAKGFYDRSLGAIVNGAPAAQPYQLKTASGGAAPRDGAVTTAYDDAGNLVGLSLVRNAGAPCLPVGPPCSQRFAYDWDEVGRLVRARRWDGAGLGVASDPLPSTPPVVELLYAYDASNERLLKAAIDGSGVASYTAYVFESLELRGAPFDGTSYADTTATEVPYLFAHDKRIARVHFSATDVPTASSGQIHVLLELADYLGSSSSVIDRETSELVERSTYTPYGAPDDDYRPARWDSFREDYRFTGKEEDVEVGVQYFGARYLHALLGRWLSVDPLAVHGLGADPNAYAYVHGRVLARVDSDGLEDTGGTSMPGSADVEATPPPGGTDLHLDSTEKAPTVDEVLKLAPPGTRAAHPASESAPSADFKKTMALAGVAYPASGKAISTRTGYSFGGAAQGTYVKAVETDPDDRSSFNAILFVYDKKGGKLIGAYHGSLGPQDRYVSNRQQILNGGVVSGSYNFNARYHKTQKYGTGMPTLALESDADVSTVGPNNNPGTPGDVYRQQGDVPDAHFASAVHVHSSCAGSRCSEACLNLMQGPDAQGFLSHFNPQSRGVIDAVRY
jgi:RHS repeat-associated protein